MLYEIYGYCVECGAKNTGTQEELAGLRYKACSRCDRQMKVALHEYSSRAERLESPKRETEEHLKGDKGVKLTGEFEGVGISSSGPKSKTAGGVCAEQREFVAGEAITPAKLLYSLGKGKVEFPEPLSVEELRRVRELLAEPSEGRSFMSGFKCGRMCGNWPGLCCDCTFFNAESSTCGNVENFEMWGVLKKVALTFGCVNFAASGTGK